MKLVIVESPTKARTISKFLGEDYLVESSYGHIRDLPKSKLSIDVEHNFEPTYEIPAKARPVVERLKNEAAKASAVVLATDEDREGEAIAWHIAQTLGLTDANQRMNANDTNKKQKNDSRRSDLARLRSSELERADEFADSHRVSRIVFHEITEPAIKEALQTPRRIDLNLVNAQQARRVLDRLVGYELSPFLWRKIRYGLSAGRVQSVAVRLIVEREREIQNFISQEYWSIEALLSKIKSDQKFPARLYSIQGKTLGKMDLKTEIQAKNVVADLKGADYAVSDLATKDVSRYPSPPFTTSTLQQESARQLGLSAKETMYHAQQLYERGLITYMRTDSVTLSATALSQARKVIIDRFGKEYALSDPRQFATKTKGAQEAHEAIRPTDLSVSPGEFQAKRKTESYIYGLIWKRTIASQMPAALMEQTSVNIEAKNKSNQPAARGAASASPPPEYVFRATGQVVKFDGFMKVYTEGRDENNNDDNHTKDSLPQLEKGEGLKLHKLSPLQHFTEPPPRYTDATLIKTLESFGIGRPSTYAPTLSTIQERGYAEKIEKKYHPTEIGALVNDMLTENFPEIVDIQFTAKMEEELDEIAEGKNNWVNVCRDFYKPFKKHLAKKEKTVEKRVEISDTPCPHCGKAMLIKFGRMGKFLACPEPESKVTLPLPEEAAKIRELEEQTKDERCPLCEKPMTVRRGRFGFFLGCSDYPSCKGLSKIWNKTGFKCPLCLETLERKENPGDIVEKKGRGRGRPFYACTRYPDCTFVMNKKPESDGELQDALEIRKSKTSSANRTGVESQRQTSPKTLRKSK